MARNAIFGNTRNLPAYYLNMSELRYALRALFKNPGLALAAIICLALGIGVNTAIYTVVNAVVLRPLPFKDPERLARIYTEFPTYGSSGGFHKFWMSTPELLDLRRLTKSWASLEAYTISGVNLSGGAEPVRVTAASITGGMLPMLGVAPRLGRLPGPDDDRFGAPLTLVLSDGLWRRVLRWSSEYRRPRTEDQRPDGNRDWRHAARIRLSSRRNRSARTLVSAADQSQ